MSQDNDSKSKESTRKAKWFRKTYSTPPSGSAGGISSRVGVPGPRRESFNDVSRACTAYLHKNGMQVGYARMQYGSQSPEFKTTEETEA